MDTSAGGNLRDEFQLSESSRKECGEEDIKMEDSTEARTAEITDNHKMNNEQICHDTSGDIMDCVPSMGSVKVLTSPERQAVSVAAQEGLDKMVQMQEVNEEPMPLSLAGALDAVNPVPSSPQTLGEHLRGMPVPVDVASWLDRSQEACQEADSDQDQPIEMDRADQPTETDAVDQPTETDTADQPSTGSPAPTPVQINSAEPEDEDETTCMSEAKVEQTEKKSDPPDTEIGGSPVKVENNVDARPRISVRSAGGTESSVPPLADPIMKSWLKLTFGGRSVFDVLPTLAGISGVARNEEEEEEKENVNKINDKDSAKVSEPQGPRKVEDAISYVNLIKTTYKHDQATFNKFLCLLRDFKFQRISLDNIMKDIKALFKDNLYLVKGFDQFLPASKRQKSTQPEFKADHGPYKPGDMFCQLFYGHKSEVLPLLQPRVPVMCDYSYPEVENSYETRAKSDWTQDMSQMDSPSLSEDETLSSSDSEPEVYFPIVKRGRGRSRIRTEEGSPPRRGRGRARGRGRGIMRGVSSRPALKKSPSTKRAQMLVNRGIRRKRGRPPLIRPLGGREVATAHKKQKVVISESDSDSDTIDTFSDAETNPSKQTSHEKPRSSNDTDSTGTLSNSDVPTSSDRSSSRGGGRGKRSFGIKRPDQRMERSDFFRAADHFDTGQTINRRHNKPNMYARGGQSKILVPAHNIQDPDEEVIPVSNAPSMQPKDATREEQSKSGVSADGSKVEARNNQSRDGGSYEQSMKGKSKLQANADAGEGNDTQSFLSKSDQAGAGENTTTVNFPSRSDQTRKEKKAKSQSQEERKSFSHKQKTKRSNDHSHRRTSKDVRRSTEQEPGGSHQRNKQKTSSKNNNEPLEGEDIVVNTRTGEDLDKMCAKIAADVAANPFRWGPGDVMEHIQLKTPMKKKEKKRKKRDNVLIHETLTYPMPYIQPLDMSQPVTNLVSLDQVTLEDVQVKVLNKPGAAASGSPLYQCEGVVKLMEDVTESDHGTTEGDESLKSSSSPCRTSVKFEEQTRDLTLNEEDEEEEGKKGVTEEKEGTEESDTSSYSEVDKGAGTPGSNNGSSGHKPGPRGRDSESSSPEASDDSRDEDWAPGRYQHDQNHQLPQSASSKMLQHRPRPRSSGSYYQQALTTHAGPRPARCIAKAFPNVPLRRGVTETMEPQPHARNKHSNHSYSVVPGDRSPNKSRNVNLSPAATLGPRGPEVSPRPAVRYNSPLVDAPVHSLTSDLPSVGELIDSCGNKEEIHIELMYKITERGGSSEDSAGDTVTDIEEQEEEYEVDEATGQLILQRRTIKKHPQEDRQDAQHTIHGGLETEVAMTQAMTNSYCVETPMSTTAEPVVPMALIKHESLPFIPKCVSKIEAPRITSPIGNVLDIKADEIPQTGPCIGLKKSVSLSQSEHQRLAPQVLDNWPKSEVPFSKNSPDEHLS